MKSFILKATFALAIIVAVFTSTASYSLAFTGKDAASYFNQVVVDPLSDFILYLFPGTPKSVVVQPVKPQVIQPTTIIVQAPANPKQLTITTAPPQIVNRTTVVQGVSERELNARLQNITASFDEKIKNLPPAVVTGGITLEQLNQLQRNIGLAGQSAPSPGSVIYTPNLTNPSVTGNLSASGDISANAFYGDGSHLTGIVGGSGWLFSTSTIRSLFSAGSNVTYSTSTGVISATGGGGSITSSDNSLTIAGSDAIINLGNSNIWTATQTIGYALGGSQELLKINAGNTSNAGMTAFGTDFTGNAEMSLRDTSGNTGIILNGNGTVNATELRAYSLVGQSGSGSSVLVGNWNFVNDTMTNGSGDITTNRLGVGVTPTTAIDVSSYELTNVGVQRLVNSGSASYVPMATYLAPNLTSGQQAFVAVGTDPSAKNWAGFGFTYIGNGSDSNRLDFNFHSTLPVISALAGGNVGIGTTSPLAKLHVTGTAGTGDVFALSSSSNARLFTVSSAGNVGIGTSTPSDKLSVVGSTTLNGMLTLGDATKGMYITGLGPIVIRTTATNSGISRNADAIDIQTSGSNAQMADCFHCFAIGAENTANGGFSNIAIGSNNSAITAYENMAIGRVNYVTGGGASAVGYRNTLTQTGTSYSSAFGAFNTISLGRGAFGYNNIVRGGGESYAIGSNNIASSTGSIVIGSGITNNTASSLMIGPSDSAKLTILSTGSVGIGTSTPSAKLDLYGNAGNGDIFTISSSTNSRLLTFTSAGRLALGTSTPSHLLDIYGSARFGTTSKPVLLVDAGVNNVGIGSSTPGAKLSIVGDDQPFTAATAVAVLDVVGGLGGGTAGNGSLISMKGGLGNGSGTGGLVLIQAGGGGATGSGGALTLNAGAGGGSGGGAGGAVSINAGAAFSSGQTGGSITLTAGAPASGGSAGAVNILGGIASCSGCPGGGVNITGGAAGSGTVNAGAVVVSGGAAMSSNNLGGQVTLRGGAGGDSSQTPGGLALITGGSGGAGGSGTGATGGAVLITGGTGGTGQFHGVGGSVYIYGGSSPSATSTFIGNVILARTASSTNQGLVGIGTSTPSAKLDLYGTPGSSDIFAISSSSNTRILTVNASGNVGIGTTTPLARLHLYQSTSAEPLALLEANTGSGGDVSMRLLGGAIGNPDEVYVEFADKNDASNSFTLGLDDDASKLQFGYGAIGTMNGHGAMTLTSSGNLGVGTVSPLYKLQIASSSPGTAVAYFVNTSTASGDEVLHLGVGGATAGTSNLFIAFYQGSTAGNEGTRIGYIQGTGSNSVSYNTTSDRRLKTNIATTTRGLEDLMKIKIKDFNFINDPSRTVQGFIAQDLYDVYPFAVAKTDNGVDPLGGNAVPWGVDYGRITPLIIQSVQDLDFKLEGLADVNAPLLSETGQQTFAGKFFNRMKEWFASATNGIESIFVKKVETNKLCVKDESGNETCITKSQLDTLLNNSNAANVGGGVSQPDPTPTPNTEPTPEVTPTGNVEPTPTPEVIPEVAPTPEPTQAPTPEPEAPSEGE